ncbi:glycerophosphodiester phosphodiesterase family protein [Mesorhizobium sp. LHD-90]|uniref:glycerophosphodiester phosphodiesterase family protein n=1 Tax=Mesorhizobium sp. LHD-90 TaxID=3071414 RepID=UPI0027E0CA76|nr:glycerophosphodiester phosphodiesterase family protein [Mesorhizobium sp. LHD-90]MDQ6434587.1 glycerophosphodiester phosphodiesterase family protein [Mesorhizobium sp. LHD-90]
MRRPFIVMLLCLLATLPMPAAAQQGRTSQILDRFENANRWRDHVMVVAHRGGWKENGIIRWAENSRAGMRYAIGLGVEMVELDVRMSSDGKYVVMHDNGLERTTDCTGEVFARTVAELKTCHLKVEGSGEVTDETVPTLAEMLEVTKGQVLVNIDNKLGPDHIAGMVAVARGLGMEGEVVLKENIFSAARLAAVEAAVADAGPGFRFMPIIADDAVEDPRFVETVTRTFAADMVEMVAWRGERRLLPSEGGALFSARMRAVAARGDWHLWVNTYPIVNLPSGFTGRGRGDELAVQAGFPEEVFGFWAERGATVIQTDEPKAAIEWLEQNGMRQPYGLTN